MSPKTKSAASAVGDRLPYLLSKLKTPRVLERLEQTAATAAPRAATRGRGRCAALADGRAA